MVHFINTRVFVLPLHHCTCLFALQGRLPVDLLSRELRQQLQVAQAGSSTAAAGLGQAGAAVGAASLVGFSCLYSWGNGANLTLGTGERLQLAVLSTTH